MATADSRSIRSASVAVGLISLVAIVLVTSERLPTNATYESIDPTSFGTKLAPLLVIALLIERTIEVFFGVWREPDDRKSDAKVSEIARVVAEGSLATGALTRALEESADRTAVNTRLAFLMGGSFGLLAAIAGARVLALLVVKTPSSPAAWNLLDIVLTAGLLGGGADGFHHIMAVISSFLQATQHKAESADPKAGATRTAALTAHNATEVA